MSRDLERRGRDPHEDLKKEGSRQGNSRYKGLEVGTGWKV